MVVNAVGIRVGRWVVGGLLGVLLALSACNLGPSEERLGCLNGCARQKDQCMLDAMTPQGIQACDLRASECSKPCPQ